MERPVLGPVVDVLASKPRLFFFPFPNLWSVLLQPGIRIVEGDAADGLGYGSLRRVGLRDSGALAFHGPSPYLLLWRNALKPVRNG